MKRMDAVRLGEVERIRQSFNGKELTGLLAVRAKMLVDDLITEVRASNREIQGLKEENERLREQLAAEGRQVVR